MSGLFYQVLAAVLGFISTSAISYCVNLVKQNKKNRSQELADFEVVKTGIRCLLKAQLKEDFEYFTKQGYCQVEDKEEYENLYRAYHGLGGNGLGTNLYEAVMKMPSTKPKKDN